MLDSELKAVDAHQHFWQLTRFHYEWMSSSVSVLQRDYLPLDLQPLLGETGIQRTVLVQAHQSVEETRWLLALTDSHPWIAAVVGWFDLTTPDGSETLDRLTQHPRLKGIRHLVHDEADDRWLLRADVLQGLSEVARHGLTYDLLLRPQHLACVQPLADRCPDLKLVVDHMAKPLIREGIWQPWADDIAAVARIPGSYCKLSGMVTEADHGNWRWQDLQPYIDHVLEHFGEDRLMFGSDWPVCLLAASYEQAVESLSRCLREAGVNEKGFSKIFGANAAAFYGLDRDGHRQTGKNA